MRFAIYKKYFISLPSQIMMILHQYLENIIIVFLLQG